MKGYPAWFTRELIAGIFLALFVSGLVLAMNTFEMRLQWDVPWRPSGDLRIATAALHAFFSLVTLGILGALWSLHMRLEWRRKKQRASGAGLTALFVFLALSGLGIYYLSSEALALWTSLAHLAAGVFIFLVFFWHILKVSLRKDNPG